MRSKPVCSACGGNEVSHEYCFDCFQSQLGQSVADILLGSHRHAFDSVTVSICSSCAQRHVKGVLLREFGWGVCPAVCVVPGALGLAYSTIKEGQFLGILLAGLGCCYYVFGYGWWSAYNFARILVSRIGREEEVTIFAHETAKGQLASDANCGFERRDGILYHHSYGRTELKRSERSPSPPREADSNDPACSIRKTLLDLTDESFWQIVDLSAHGTPISSKLTRSIPQKKAADMIIDYFVATNELSKLKQLVDACIKLQAKLG